MERRRLFGMIKAATVVTVANACGIFENQNNANIITKETPFGQIYLRDKSSGEMGAYSMILKENSLEKTVTDHEELGEGFALNTSFVKQPDGYFLSFAIEGIKTDKDRVIAKLDSIDTKAVHTVKAFWSDGKFENVLLDDRKIEITKISPPTIVK